MGKDKIDATRRLLTFPNSGLVVQNTRIWCERCLTFVEFERKSTVDRHVKSEKHLSWKGKHLLYF